MRLTFKYCLLSLALVLGLGVVVDGAADNKIYITNNSPQPITVKLRCESNWPLVQNKFTSLQSIPDGQTRFFSSIAEMVTL